MKLNLSSALQPLLVQSVKFGLISFAFLVSPALADDAAEVRATFTNYKSAILAGEGDAAVDQISQNTIEYYGAMQKLAVCADAATVKAQSMLDRVQIFSMRFRVPAPTLLTLSDEGVVAYGVEQGWIGKEGVMNIELGEVTLENNEAFAVILQNRQPAGIRFRFVKESGDWKLDLLPIIELSNLAFQELAKQEEIEENEFIFALLALLEGREPTEAVWNPIDPKHSLCR
ncbi:MAG: hypothetical protein ACRC8A_00100 [Microcoleaceae cyanobacterium]